MTFGDNVQHHSVFAVAERVACVWDRELLQANEQFCRSLNPRWFVESADRHLSHDGIEESGSASRDSDSQNLAEDQHSDPDEYTKSTRDSEMSRMSRDVAHAVRAVYHHAVESFFALLFASFQAPCCLATWLALYDQNDLTFAINRVNSGGLLLNAWGVPAVTWDELARVFTECAWPDGAVGTAETRTHFSSLWRRLATEFLNPAVRSEHSAIKHGFRARAGGGAIFVQPEVAFGVPQHPPSLLGGSSYGSRVLRVLPYPAGTKLKKATHYTIERVQNNWSLESTYHRLRFLAFSMQNVQSTLLRRFGAPAAEAIFLRPADLAMFNLAWSHDPTLPSFAIQLEGWPSQVRPTDQAELRAKMHELSGVPPASDGADPNQVAAKDT